jgi:hypothetical protein
MPYTPEEVAVLKKYRIILPAGEKVKRGGKERTLPADEIRTCNLKQPLGRPLGEGPIINPDALDKLLHADHTPDKQWLDWIFFQAGGGERAQQMREAALQQIKDRFIDERVNGFQHPDTHDYVPPVDRKLAEERWRQAEPRFKDILKVCDQDSVTKLNTFGFFRQWPGVSRIYENVVNAIERFQKFFKKAEQMNKEVLREGGATVPLTPDAIKTWEEMDKISNKVERYFASKVARDDIRLSAHPSRKDNLIYDDDYIEVLAPLTWAAAVRYGYPGWSWANRETFDQVLSDESNDFHNEWKKKTAGGKAYVYLIFHAPVPIWVARTQGTFKRYELTNLALELDIKNLRNLGNVDKLTVWDEENRNSMTIKDVKNMIMAEPTRQDPQDEEVPITRGANVISTPEEAKATVDHLNMALAAMVEWAQSFDPATIKKDAMKLD